jgi:hypothetical protein
VRDEIKARIDGAKTVKELILALEAVWADEGREPMNVALQYILKNHPLKKEFDREGAWRVNAHLEPHCFLPGESRFAGLEEEGSK